MSGAALERPAAASPVGDLLRLLSLPLLGFLGFAVGLAIGIPSNRIGLLGAAIAMTIVGLAPLVLDSVRPPARRNLLLSIFSLAYLANFVVPAFVDYLGNSGYAPETFAHLRGLTPEDITAGLVAVLVAYLMLLLGYASPIGARASRVIPRMQREWSHETTLVVALIMIPLGWTVYLAGQFGLIPRQAGSGALGTLALAAPFGLALLTICRLRYRSGTALALLCLLIPPTMAFNFFTASKLLFLMPPAMVATAHILVTRRLRIWWVAGFIAAMTLLYPVQQTYRNYMFGNRLTVVQVLQNPHYVVGLLQRFVRTSEFGTYLREGLQATSARFDAIAITSVIVRDAGERVPYQGGWSLGYIAISYVPRVLWPGKPSTTIGQWVTDHFGSGPFIESNTGPSWVGELFFNFGWAGITFGMLLLGVWFRFLQDSFLNANATIPGYLAGVVALFAIAPFVQGGLIGPINGVVYNVTPIMLTHLVVRAVTRPTRPLPPAV